MPVQNSSPKQHGALPALSSTTRMVDCSDVNCVQLMILCHRYDVFSLNSFQTIAVLKHIIDTPIVCPPGYALDRNGKCRPVYK